MVTRHHADTDKRINLERNTADEISRNSRESHGHATNVYRRAEKTNGYVRVYDRQALFASIHDARSRLLIY